MKTSSEVRFPLYTRAVPYLPLGLIAALGAILAYVQKLPCRTGGWNEGRLTYTNFCYTDIFPLYFARQLSTQDPYFATVPPEQHVEYPVVLGEVMQAFAWIARRLAPGDVYQQGVWFYDLTVVLLGV